ncbi:FAD-dependent oxidoreductase [soil metagenome]
MSERKSVWRRSVERQKFDRLSEGVSADVVVVGAGITGLTSALLLQRADRHVVCVEAEEVGAGTTGGTTGKVTSQHGLIYADLISRHGMETAQSYAEANELAVDLVRLLSEELEIDGVMSASAYVYSGSSEDMSLLEDEFKAAESLGLPAQLADGNWLPFPVAGVLEFTNQLQIHPIAYLDALASAFVEEGGTLYENTRVDGLNEVDGRVTVSAGSGSVTAGHAVIATLLPFIDRGGFFARTTPSRAYGVAALLERPPPEGMYIGISDPVGSFRPWLEGGETGIIVVGETHDTGHGDATPGRWGELERWTNENFDVASFEYRWSAQDYRTVDGIPYVGRSPLTERTWVATGFAKWGLSNGTAAASMITDEIQGVGNPHASTFNARRIGDAKAVAELVAMNAHVGKQFIKGRIASLISASIDDLSEGDGAVVDHDGERVAAYRDPSGRVHAVRVECTHLGCYVSWNDAENTWDCPCHGSRFAIDGAIITGPATEPLEQVSLE